MLFLALTMLAVSAAQASSGYSYQGRYRGKCNNDGIYYNDESSFTFCSNGNAYNQPCAPGSRNLAYDRYQQGGNYGYSDFCGVNLVDYGYAAGGYHSTGYGTGPSNSYHDNDRHDNGYGKVQSYHSSSYGSTDGYGKDSYKPDNKGYEKTEKRTYEYRVHGNDGYGEERRAPHWQ